MQQKLRLAIWQWFGAGQARQESLQSAWQGFGCNYSYHGRLRNNLPEGLDIILPPSGRPMASAFMQSFPSFLVIFEVAHTYVWIATIYHKAIRRCSVLARSVNSFRQSAHLPSIVLAHDNA